MNNEQESNFVDEETPVIHLELDDGTEMDCAVICQFEVDDLDYLALVSVEDLESDDDRESAVLIYRYTESQEDESFRLDNIEDDDEYDKVTAALDDIFSEEFGEEE